MPFLVIPRSLLRGGFIGDLEGNLKRLQERLKAKTFEPVPVTDIEQVRIEEKRFILLCIRLRRSTMQGKGH